MSNIRVQYSGLLAFFVGIITIFTGLFFVLILTRTLTVEEFGTWSLINTIVGYLIVSQALFDFWTIRGISRGLDVGRTSFNSSVIFSFGLIPIYIALVILSSENSNTIQSSMILAFVLVPLYFISRNLTVINSSFQPHVTSYSLLVLETAKIPMVLIFVYFFNLGLDGAILALFLAQLIHVSYQIHRAWIKIKTKFNINLLKKWLKFSWLTLYSAGPNLLKNLDVVLYTLITSSVIGIAFYAVALTMGRLVSHSEKISQGLYPKLLSGGAHSHISQNFSLFFLFGIPIVGLSIIFAKPGLYALNPIYQEATLIVIFLSLKTFFLAQSNTIQQALLGIEKADITENPTAKLFLKSNLFKVPTYSYIKLGIYLIILVVVFILNKDNVSEIELVTMWAFVAVIIEIPFLIFMWILLYQKTSIHFPYKDTIKYLVATITFMIIFWQTSEFIIVYHESIFDFFPTVIAQFTLCISIYFGITYTIDKKTRKLFSIIVSYIYKK